MGFAWLEDHWPDEGPTVLSWGDARIGNLMYRDFTPVAVLDWEMATLGPRELDVGWMIYLHRFFDDLAVSFGLPGLPDFLRRDAVAEQYEPSPVTLPRDLDWYTAYAAVRHAVIMTRVGLRWCTSARRDAGRHRRLRHPPRVARSDARGRYWDTVPTMSEALMTAPTSRRSHRRGSRPHGRVRDLVHTLVVNESPTTRRSRASGVSPARRPRSSTVRARALGRCPTSNTVKTLRDAGEDTTFLDHG